jgi:hypothetical protein
MLPSRRCRHCQQIFQPSNYCPRQSVCSKPECQRRRKTEYHRQKVHRDALYAQVVRDSQKKWREAHPQYSKQYRQTHPEAAEGNRRQQQRRDQQGRIQDLAKNNLALDLKCSVSEVWFVGPGVKDLAKNNLASAKVFIYQPVRNPPAMTPSS